MLGTLLFNGAAMRGDHPLELRARPLTARAMTRRGIPARDLAAATAKASAEGKKVLLLVGANGAAGAGR